MESTPHLGGAASEQPARRPSPWALRAREVPSLPARPPLGVDALWFLRCSPAPGPGREEGFWRTFGEALEDLESCGQSELLRELEVRVPVGGSTVVALCSRAVCVNARTGRLRGKALHTRTMGTCATGHVQLRACLEHVCAHV